MSQDPAVVIPSDDLSAERHRRTDGENGQKSIRGQIRAALGRRTVASDLRSVDAEQSDALRDPRERGDDGVAVDDLENDRG